MIFRLNQDLNLYIMNKQLEFEVIGIKIGTVKTKLIVGAEDT